VRYTVVFEWQHGERPVGGFVTFKWNAGEEAYIATRGCAFDRNRRIVAIDGDERLREPTKQDSEASA